jgi:hypothetical protein
MAGQVSTREIPCVGWGMIRLPPTPSGLGLCFILVVCLLLVPVAVPVAVACRRRQVVEPIGRHWQHSQQVGCVRVCMYGWLVRRPIGAWIGAATLYLL